MPVHHLQNPPLRLSPPLSTHAKAYPESWEASWTPPTGHPAPFARCASTHPAQRCGLHRVTIHKRRRISSIPPPAVAQFLPHPLHQRVPPSSIRHVPHGPHHFCTASHDQPSAVPRLHPPQLTNIPQCIPHGVLHCRKPAHFPRSIPTHAARATHTSIPCQRARKHGSHCPAPRTQSSVLLKQKLPNAAHSAPTFPPGSKRLPPKTLMRQPAAPFPTPSSVILAISAIV